MKIINTTNPQARPPVVMLVYGRGGVGKTTFASTAPMPIMADCEGGTKYFGLRGIELEVGIVEKWSDMQEFLAIANTDKYKTLIIDPIGELMEKLMRFMVAKGDKKLVQNDGSPTMAGWGFLKNTMRAYLKALRDTGKHIIIIAHDEEHNDDGAIIKRPKIATKLSEELVAMVDIVGYMTIARNEDGEDKHCILVDTTNDKYIAKDRTGQLGNVIEPDFSKIINACQGTETYKWSNKNSVSITEKQETKTATKETKKIEPEKKTKKIIEEIEAIEEAEQEEKLQNPILEQARKKLRDKMTQ